MRSRQPALGHLPPVQQQVPPIGNLSSSRRSEPDAAGILGRAVTGDGANAATAPEPVGERRGAPVRQQVDHPPPLEIDQDGPVALALAPGPIIDADDARGRPVRQGQSAHEAQHRRAARRHAQAAQQARPGRATQGHANPTLRVGQAVCPPRPRRNEAGEPLDEGPPRAGGIAAVQAPDRQFQADLAAEARQISGAARAAAVDGGTGPPAIRTAAAPRPDLGTDVDDVGTRPGHPKDPAPRHGMNV
jgi:hypothetical protein